MMAAPIILTSFAWCKVPRTRPCPNYIQLGEVTSDDQGNTRIEIADEEGLRQLHSGTVWIKYAASGLCSQPLEGPSLQSIQRAMGEINEQRPLSVSVAEDVYENYGSEYGLEWNKNTYARNATPETFMLISSGIITGGGHCETQSERVDLKTTLDYIVRNPVSFSEVMQSPDALLSYVKDLHSRLLQSRASSREFFPGEWRNENVCLPQSDWATPQFHELPALMMSFAEWACNEWKSLPPVHFSIEVHCRLAYLHPFADGNGRAARLVMNLLLLEAGYPPIMISRHDKHRYCRALQQGFWGCKQEYYTYMLKCLQASTANYIAVLTRRKAVAHPVTIPFEKQHNFWSMESFGSRSCGSSLPSISGSPPYTGTLLGGLEKDSRFGGTVSPWAFGHALTPETSASPSPGLSPTLAPSPPRRQSALLQAALSQSSSASWGQGGSVENGWVRGGSLGEISRSFEDVPAVDPAWGGTPLGMT